MRKSFSTTINNEENLNIDNLVNEIENVLKTGIKNILKDFMDRFNLLENTHNLIMKLPSVTNELQKIQNAKNFDSNDNSDSDTLNSKEKQQFISINDLTNNLINKQISNVETKLENRLENIEKTLDSLKYFINKNIHETITCENNYTKSSIISVCDNTIVSVCENENIQLFIKEKENLLTVVEADEEDEKDEEDEEEEEEEEDEDEEEEEEKEEEEENEGEEEEEKELEKEVEEKEKNNIQMDKDREENKKDILEKINDKDEIETEASEEEVEEVEEVEEIEEVEEVEYNKEEEEELIEIEIDSKTFCTNDEENGFIFELNEEGEVGDKVGYLKEGEPFFYEDEN